MLQITNASIKTYLEQIPVDWPGWDEVEAVKLVLPVDEEKLQDVAELFVKAGEATRAVRMQMTLGV